MADKLMSVDELVRELKTLTFERKVVTFQQAPFYGKVTVTFQNGERVHIEKIESIK